MYDVERGSSMPRIYAYLVAQMSPTYLALAALTQGVPDGNHLREFAHDGCEALRPHLPGAQGLGAARGRGLVAGEGALQ